MTSNEDFRGLSAFAQRNYTSRAVADAYLQNRPETPISGLFFGTEQPTISESSSDRLVKSSAKSVKDNLSKLLLTLQRIKGLLPSPVTYGIITGFLGTQVSSLRNYLILDRMLMDRDAGGVILQRQSISVSEAAAVIALLSKYSKRLPDLTRDTTEYELALHAYFTRVSPADGRGWAALQLMAKYIPDFNQADMDAFVAYQASLTRDYYDTIIQGKAKFLLLEFVKPGITYTYSPFNFLEKGPNFTNETTQFHILTLFKYMGKPEHYPTETRDVFHMFYKTTNSYNWDREFYFSAPKLNEGQLPLLLRLTLESESLIRQLVEVYTEYVANMHKYQRTEIEQNIKVVESIANITLELKEDKGLWVKSSKSPRNFPNILVRRPSSRTDKRPLRAALHNLGNKSFVEFRDKWNKLAEELARDPRVVNPPP